eukprot:EG_transcript_16971
MEGREQEQSSPSDICASPREADRRQQALAALESLVEALSVALNHASSAIHEVKDAREQALREAVDRLQTKVMSSVDLGLDVALPFAVVADERFAVSQRLTAAAEKLQALDEALALHQRAASVLQRTGVLPWLGGLLIRMHALDQTVTRGTVEPTLWHAYHACRTALQYVAHKYHQASEGDAAQSSPPEAVTPEETSVTDEAPAPLPAVPLTQSNSHPPPLEPVAEAGPPAGRWLEAERAAHSHAAFRVALSIRR